MVLVVAAALFTLSACTKNDSKPTPRTKTYKIQTYPGYNVSGTATFTEVLNADSVIVAVKLSGSSVSNVTLFPVYIRQGTSLENGPVAFDLGNLDGNIGNLQSEINLSFSDLLNFNGSIGVYRNTTDTNRVIAQGEVGANEIFTAHNMYNPLSTSQINGQFRIYKRSTGAYLVIGLDTSLIQTNGIIGSHPARVYKADGTRDFDLSHVSGMSGVSGTNITDHTYGDLTGYDGMIKVLLAQDMQDVTISQGSFKK